MGEGSAVRFGRDEPVNRSPWHKEPIAAMLGGLVGVTFIAAIGGGLLVYLAAQGLWSVIVVLVALAVIQILFLRWRGSVVRKRLAVHGEGRSWAAFVRVSPVELALMGRGRGMRALKLLTRWQFRFLVVDGDESYVSQRVREQEKGPELPITRVDVVSENADGEIRRVLLVATAPVEVDVLWSTPFPDRKGRRS